MQLLTRNSKINFTNNDSIRRSAKSLIKSGRKLNLPAVKSKESSKNSSDKENKTTSNKLIPIDFKLTAPVPTKNKKGQLVFDDRPEFSPNLTPKKVLRVGSFGSTYFRPTTRASLNSNTGRKCGRSCPRTGSRAWTSEPGCSAASMTRPQPGGVEKFRLDEQTESLWLVPVVLQILSGKKN